MRLTLRTLLAYLDDSLEAAHAREIGAKIAESPMAAELAGRIREVLRRRRITAPQISGPGSGPDPNLTSEYLDNTMSPEAVAEFEQFCLESDVHLAEVAACHQILTLVLGEPAEVSAELRERMYAMGAVAAESTTDDNGRSLEDRPAMAAGDHTGTPTAAGQPASFEEGLPRQLRRKSFAARAIPAALVVICIGWLALLATDPYLRGRSETPQEPANALVVDGGSEDASAAAAADEPVVSPADPSGQPAPVEPSTDSVDTPDPGGEEPVAPIPEVDTTEPGAESTVDPNPDTVAATVPDPGATPPATPMPDPEAFPPPPVQPVDVVTTLYNSPEGILLQGNRETGEWTVMPRNALLHAGNEIACPKPFTARLQIDNGVCIVTLAGGTRVRVTGSNAGGPFGFELLRGRLGLFRMSSDAPDGEPVACGVQVGDRLYGVRLMEPNTWCGFEVVPEQPRGRAEPDAVSVGGGVFVARGFVELTDPAAGAMELRPENGWRSWSTEVAQPLLAVPNWLSLEGAPVASSDKRYATLYEKEFPLDVPVWQSIPAIVRDRRPMLSKFAVETLALTGNRGELVRALSAEHQESRRAAIVGLREWLLQSDSHPALLPDELRLTFRDKDAAAIETLLWGYSIDDGRDPATSAQLVDWLASDEVAIRELALFHIEMLTGRDNDFHPTASLAQRDAAIARWREFLQRNRSLVPEG